MNPYFRKHVENFVNVIRNLQIMYGFFDLPRNWPAFPINNFLLIPAKVAIWFPTVFCNFILITIADRSFVFIWPHRFTEVNYFTVTTVNLINDIVLSSVATRSLGLQRSLRKVLSVLIWFWNEMNNPVWWYSVFIRPFTKCAAL